MNRAILLSTSRICYAPDGMGAPVAPAVPAAPAAPATPAAPVTPAVPATPAAPTTPTAPDPSNAKPEDKSLLGGETAEKPAEITPVDPKTYKLPDALAALKPGEDPMLDSFLETAGAQGLSNEQMNKVLEAVQPKLQELLDKPRQAYEAMRQEWRDQTMADAEIGGAAWAENQGRIQQFLGKFGTPELLQAFNTTGAGDHPAVVKFIARMAKIHTEGGAVFGAAAAPKVNALDAMYPSASKG